VALGFELSHLDRLEAGIDLGGDALPEPDGDDPFQLARSGKIAVKQGEPVRQGGVLKIGACDLRLDGEGSCVAIECCGGHSVMAARRSARRSAEQVEIVGDVEPRRTHR
jgi:hypothetical protein